MFNRKAISLYEVLTIQTESKPAKMIILNLNTIGQDIEGVSQPFGLYMAESAAVCFHSQGHKSGVKLLISDGNTTENGQVEWANEMTNSVLASHLDEKRTTDFGAMGVAVLLACRLTDYTNFKTSRTDNGYDFKLRKKDADGNFMKATLEVSGIRKETPQNTVKSRLVVKKKQILKRAKKGSINYVSIIEFSKPEANFILI